MLGKDRKVKLNNFEPTDITKRYTESCYQRTLSAFRWYESYLEKKQNKDAASTVVTSFSCLTVIFSFLHFVAQ